MKAVFILFALVAVVVSLPEETYNPAYDSFDANELAGNVRLLKSYTKCFLGKGPCTAEGTDFKKVMPEAIRTSCGKCTPKQRELVRIVIKAIQQKLPDLWEELVKKEDPEGAYTKSFQEFINGTN